MLLCHLQPPAKDAITVILATTGGRTVPVNLRQGNAGKHFLEESCYASTCWASKSAVNICLTRGRAYTLTCQEQKKTSPSGLVWVWAEWEVAGERETVVGTEGCWFLPQRDVCEDPGQAASPRVLRVQRLWHQSQAERTLLCGRPNLLREARAGTGGSPGGLRGGHRLPKVNHAAHKASVDGLFSADFPWRALSLPPAESCLQ